MNLMMSGAMWTGFEPEEEGLFNETYVEILQVFYGDEYDGQLLYAFTIFMGLSSGDCGESWQAWHLYLPRHASSINILIFLIIIIIIIILILIIITIIHPNTSKMAKILLGLISSTAFSCLFTSLFLPSTQDVLTGVDGYWGIPPWLYAKMTPPTHPYPW